MRGGIGAMSISSPSPPYLPQLSPETDTRRPADSTGESRLRHPGIELVFFTSSCSDAAVVNSRMSAFHPLSPNLAASVTSIDYVP